MINNPKISIILPVYNTESFLEQAIDSVLAQAVNDWELIAVNDASTDNSLDILEGYAKEEQRIRIIDLKKNQGLGRVRNLAMKAAKGDYLLFLDSDDFFTKDAFEILSDFMQEKPGREVYVWGFHICDRSGKVLKTPLPSLPDDTRGETPFQLGLLCAKGFLPFACAYVVRKSLIEKHNIGFAEGIYFEDLHFNTRLLFHTEKLEVIKHPCFFYRRHKDSITGKSSKQKIDDKFTAFTGIKTFLQEQGVFQKYQGTFLVRFLAHCVYTCFNEYFLLPTAERDRELNDYMYKIRKSKLLRKENLLLVRNVALSAPKTEKGFRKSYLGAYYGLNAIKKRYVLHRLMVQFFGWLHRKRNGLA